MDMQPSQRSDNQLLPAHGELAELRAQIDELDKILAATLAKRLGTAADIAKLKHAAGLALYDSERERVVVEQAVEGLPPQLQEYISEIYHTILKASRAHQGETINSSAPPTQTAPPAPPDPPASTVPPAPPDPPASTAPAPPDPPASTVPPAPPDPPASTAPAPPDPPASTVPPAPAPAQTNAPITYPEQTALLAHDACCPPEQDKPSQARTNWVLIGMPGVGKQGVGTALAAASGRRLLDTDVLIQEKTGRHPGSIITEDGEEAFRLIESEIVCEAARETGVIIATGGGSLLKPENTAALKQSGRLLWLRRPLNQLARGGRPLSSSLEALEAMAKRRYPLYEAASDETLDLSTDWEDNCAQALALFSKAVGDNESPAAGSC